MVLSETDLTTARDALASAEDAVSRLHAGCCEPGRSPRMETLTATLTSARERLNDFDGDSKTADEVISILEHAGEQIGSLQVSCCAPGRMPLYATALEGLMKTQRAVNRALNRGH